MNGYKYKRPSDRAKVCLILSLLFLLYWFSTLHGQLISILKEEEIDIFNENSKDKYFKEVCFENKLQPRLEMLPANLEVWQQVGQRECRSLYEKFMAMYSLEVELASLTIGSEVKQKLMSWLGNNKKLFGEALAQRIFTLHDSYNHRFTVFNAVRGKRPMAESNKSNKMFLTEPTDAEKLKCDFCHPLTMTAEDSFGRIFGKHSISAANIFKLNKWHGLFLTKRHSIVNMPEDEFIDLFNTALKWIKTVHGVDNTARYPVLFWDIFPHAGASQMHIHVHGIVGSGTYPGKFGDLFSVTKDFRSKEYSYYWSSFIRIHEALGLVIHFKKAIALAPLVPQRSHEIWLIALEPCTELFQLLYFTTKMYQDRLGQFCYSMGAALPVPDDQHFNPDNSLPSVIQIGTRGDCSSSVNDISSVELYLFNNVNSDPYVTISNLQKHIELLSSKDHSANEEIIKYFKPSTLAR